MDLTDAEPDIAQLRYEFDDAPVVIEIGDWSFTGEVLAIAAVWDGDESGTDWVVILQSADGETTAFPLDQIDQIERT